MKIQSEAKEDLVHSEQMNKEAKLDEASDVVEVFFQTRDNIACTIVTIVYCLFVLIFPIYTYRIVSLNFNSLNTKKTKKWHGYIIEDVNTKTVDQALYNVYFMVRRFAIVVVLIFMSPWPFFQSVAFSALSIINCSYLVASKPLQDKKAQNIEIFNEMTIYVCSLFVTTLINVAIHFTSRTC